ncbi:Fur family transcriptional regulator [Zhouia sp. PK063]|uniref:Fur family transcriptional regulator n=1 Tax=Zhouia sp. PK063 TaxID=3373602 RepID=UPI00379E9FAC
MKEISNILEVHHIRPTAMRILALHFLKQQHAAISLSDIENGFEKSDRTTLYRTLKTFEDKGLVHQIDDGSGIPKYAINKPKKSANDVHLHFHCTKCGETLCLTEHQLSKINLPENFIPEEFNLVVKGLCSKCNNPTFLK